MSPSNAAAAPAAAVSAPTCFVTDYCAVDDNGAVGNGNAGGRILSISRCINFVLGLTNDELFNFV